MADRIKVFEVVLRRTVAFELRIGFQVHDGWDGELYDNGLTPDEAARRALAMPKAENIAAYTRVSEGEPSVVEVGETFRPAPAPPDPIKRAVRLELRRRRAQLEQQARASIAAMKAEATKAADVPAEPGA